MEVEIAGPTMGYCCEFITGVLDAAGSDCGGLYARDLLSSAATVPTKLSVKARFFCTTFSKCVV